MQPSEMKAMEKRALERLTKARMALVLRQPFFGSLALRLKPACAWWIPTCAVDGKHLFYNPSYVEAQDDAHLRGLVCHEVLHCANGHPWRRDSREPGLWNWACDYAIDPIIVKAGMVVPDQTIDPKYAGSAEQNYAIMREEKAQQAKQQQQAQGSGAGAGTPGQAGADASDEGQPGQGQPQPGNNPASAGEDAPTDPRAPKHPATKGEVLDAPKETAAKDEADWKVAVVQAYEAAKAQGKAPAGVDRMIETFIAPKVDWKAVLRRFVQNLAALDYTWRLPSARYMASGLYLPRLQSEQMPPIVIGVDTSGSIGQVELAAFTAEVSAVIEECKPEVTHVVYCDAEIAENGTQEFLPGDPLVYRPTGGGGTSFVPVFDWIEEQGIDPACVIYLTDCMGIYPKEEPGYPVLWASSTKEPGHYAPPFGDFLYIGE